MNDIANSLATPSPAAEPAPSLWRDNADTVFVHDAAPAPSLVACRAELEKLKHDYSWALGTAQEEKEQAESERDTARAEVKATHAAHTVQLNRLQANRTEITALQAKMARAVALLENETLPLCSEDGEIEYGVKRALEVLR